jgi:hypothetical protein
MVKKIFLLFTDIKSMITNAAKPRPITTGSVAESNFFGSSDSSG